MKRLRRQHDPPEAQQPSGLKNDGEHMHKKIPALKALLNIQPEDEQEILRYQPYLQQNHSRFYASIQQWADKHEFVSRQVTPKLLIPDFFCALISGHYADRFHSTLYRQSLHWYHLKLDVDQVLLLLGRICQELQEYSAPLGSARLQRALGLIIEIARILGVKIHRLGLTLQAIKEKSEYEAVRIHHAFSLLAANLPEDLVQAYMDHMLWMYEAISLILGTDIRDTTHIPTSTECKLAVWLDSGGRDAIPEDQLTQLDTAHHAVHRLAVQVREEVRQRRTEQIFTLQEELERASRTIGQILLRCIDESISQFASYDTLTKLRNRSTLASTFQRELALATRYRKHMGVIILDIDHFKAINDEHGHLFGDQVLIELGRCLKRHIRQEDILFRWGGEEFLILGLTDSATHGNITVLAERIRQAVETTIFCADSDTPVQFTISAGVVEFEPGSGLPMDRIFDEADKLLYQAKQTGRNRVVSEFLAKP